MIRKITYSDFNGLLKLYMQLHNNPFPDKNLFNGYSKYPPTDFILSVEGYFFQSFICRHSFAYVLIKKKGRLSK